MVDRSAIFTEVLKRNAARRRGWLPPLDVRAEFEHAVSVAIDREVRALAEVPEHAAVLARIRQEVEAELLEKHGVTGDSWGGRYAIGHQASQRQMEYLRAAYGAGGEQLKPRNTVRYGEAR